MNNLDLNLLPSRAKFQAVKILWKNRANKFVIGLIGLWVMVALVTIGLAVYSQLRLKIANDQLKAAQASYASMADTVINSQKLKYKAKLVSQVLSERFEYSKVFQATKNFFPDNIKMVKFQLIQLSGVELEGETTGDNIKTLETLIKRVNEGGSDVYQSAKINNLDWKDGTWQFKMEVTLK